MRTVTVFFILCALTFGLQQAQAQSGKSYQEWLKESSGKAATKKTATKGKPAPAKAAAAAAAETPAHAPAMAPPKGTFRGIFPCNDCKEIRTELVLTGDPKDANRSFTLKQVHVGKPADKSVVTGSGRWFLAKGNKQNPEAMILQLIPTSGDLDLMYFQQVSETEVKLLTRQQGEISGPHSYSLRKL